MADPITAGNVTVDPDTGEVEGSGVALMIYQAAELARGDIYEAMPALGFGNAVPPNPDSVWRTGEAMKANRLAPVLMTLIQGMIDA